MPGSMDGLKLAHAVRNRWPPIKIIVGLGRERVAEQYLPAGGRFVAKPYDLGEIKDVLGPGRCDGLTPFAGEARAPSSRMDKLPLNLRLW